MSGQDGDVVIGGPKDATLVLGEGCSLSGTVGSSGRIVVSGGDKGIRVTSLMVGARFSGTQVDLRGPVVIEKGVTLVLRADNGKVVVEVEVLK